MSTHKFDAKKLISSIFKLPEILMERRFKTAIEAKKSYVQMRREDRDTEYALEYKRLMNQHGGFFYDKVALVENPETDADYKANISAIEKYDKNMRPIQAFDRIAYFVVMTLWTLLLVYLGFVLAIKAVILVLLVFLIFFGFWMDVIPHGGYSVLMMNWMDSLWRAFTSLPLLEMLLQLFRK